MSDFETTLTNKNIDFDTATAFSGTISSIAKCGVHTVTHTPAADSGAVVTGTMRWTKIDLDGFDMTGISHGIGGFDTLEIAGDGDSAQQFVHESKLVSSNTGTATNVAFYKPAIDSIAGTVTNLKLVDCEMDLSGIAGTVTNAYSIYSPDLDKIALINGGILTHTNIIVADYTLTDNDAGNTIYSFAGVASTITIPSTLPAGFKCDIIQGNAQITFTTSGGNSMFNKYGYTKTETAHAVVQIHVAKTGASGVCYLSGDAAS